MLHQHSDWPKTLDEFRAWHERQPDVWEFIHGVPKSRCSHSSIAAAKVYEQAGILQIAPGSASAKLTEEGGPNVFRVCGPDDRQGTKVGD